MSGTIERSHLDAIGPDTPTTDLAKSLRFVAKWTLSPPHPVPLQEAARRLDGLGELEAIVRDLAAVEYPFTEGNPVCRYCGAPLRRPHAPACDWQRCRDWVYAHPVSGDQQ